MYLRNYDLNNNYITYTVPPAGDGLTIRDILKKDLAFSARRLSSVKYALNGILLDGERSRVNKTVKTGQTLQVLICDSEKRTFHIDPVEMEIRILYEDEFYLAVDKPAGIVSHPSRGHYHDSIANGVQYYLQSRHTGNGYETGCLSLQENITPGNNAHLTGRLDKDTSGVLLFAKSGYAKEKLLSLPEDSFIKEYAAITGIMPPESHSYLTDSVNQLCIISTPLREYRDETSGLLKMAEWKSGDPPEEKKNAETEYRVLSRHGELYLLQVFIKTGRTHQIRFHLANMGYPILGDPLYGSSSSQDIAPLSHPEHSDHYSSNAINQDTTEPISRTALHCRRLAFDHPFTGEHVEITSPFPEDMKRVLHLQG